MGWRIENGFPVRVGLSPQEIEAQPEELLALHELSEAQARSRLSKTQITDELVCPECGREYKTESGLTRHISDKH